MTGENLFWGDQLNTLARHPIEGYAVNSLHTRFFTGRYKMKKNILILLCLGILLALPNRAISDCADFENATGWYAPDEKTIIYYSQNKPIAKIVLQECMVNSSSYIRLPKTYVCDSDHLLIDGVDCAILFLTIASSGSVP